LNRSPLTERFETAFVGALPTCERSAQFGASSSGSVKGHF